MLKTIFMRSAVVMLAFLQNVNAVQVCCGGVKSNGLFNRNVRCCGTEYYYPDTARCCSEDRTTNGTVVRLPSRRWDNYQLQCCGSDLYNVTTEVCCGGRTQPRARDIACCGGQTFNRRQEICCQGRITNLNDSVMFCCGDTPYDPSRYLCLPNDVIREIPSNIAYPQVCGNTIIDFSIQICCYGTALPDPRDGSRCCGRQLYRPTDQVCCNGNLVPRPEVTLPFGIQASIDYGCCGRQLITDPETQLCCNGSTRRDFGSYQERRQYACCRNEAYDIRNQTCCDGQVVDGFNVRCCGDVGYDDNRQTCCNNQLFDNGQVPIEMCCHPAGVFY